MVHFKRHLVTFPLQLDLFGTLIDDLRVVVDIARALPLLCALNCSNVNFDQHLLSQCDATHIASNITSLMLHRNTLNWQEALTILSHFSQVSTVGLMHNRIKRIDALPPSTITSLDLENNPLNSWNDVAPVAKLPQLRWLNLTRCPIGAIVLEEGDFATLEELIIKQCNIDNVSF